MFDPSTINTTPGYVPPPTSRREFLARNAMGIGGVALAWLMARPGITAPIASATTPAQLDELIAATRLTLEQSAIDRLNAAGT